MGWLDGFFLPEICHAQNAQSLIRGTPIGGLIAAVAYVVLAFQQAPVQGLLALLGALAGYALWILYCRVALEVLAAVFRIAETAAPSPQQQEYGEARYAEMVGSR